ncbi:VOC family protein [Metabacillus sp. FJAT-52054]|uniref:VOC family protein n=1 Tax=Metabacillus sediminis TaxID=3117746 RepID=A0ABZ2NIW0_9BACI
MCMSNPITPFLMFSGQAEEAMNHYLSIFDDSNIQQIFHHEDGKVMYAIFTLKGQTFRCIDNTNGDHHAFTPALSLFVAFESDEEIETIFQRLSDHGQVLMPLASSPVSEKFGWVEDKYGVSWQLNLEKKQ